MTADPRILQMIRRLWQVTGESGIREYIAWLVERAFWYADGYFLHSALHQNYYRIEGMLRPDDVADHVAFAAEASMLVELSAHIHSKEQADLEQASQIEWINERLKS